MKTELQTIVPALARDWLKRNTDNRPLRPGVVESFHAAFARGEWKITHQGIAFGKSGRLLDGQHRLTFIGQLPEGTQVHLNVTTDMDEGTFDAIDQGFRRTPSDVLGVSAGVATVGRLFAKLLMTSGSRNVSVQFVAPFVEWVTPEYEALISYCPGQARIWSSAPMRSAAIYQMKRGLDEDFIKLAYHSLVMADIDSMPYAARSLTQQFMSGKIVSARTLDLFCRGVRAFDPENSKRAKNIVIRDQTSIIEEVRHFVIGQMKKKGPTKAGPTVAKPVVNLNARRA